MVVRGEPIYAKCCDCGKRIMVNKPFLGSLHFCLSDEEIEQKRMIAMRDAQLNGKPYKFNH